MELNQLAQVLASTFDPNLRVEAEKRLNEVRLQMISVKSESTCRVSTWNRHRCRFHAKCKLHFAISVRSWFLGLLHTGIRFTVASSRHVHWNTRTYPTSRYNFSEVSYDNTFSQCDSVLFSFCATFNCSANSINWNFVWLNGTEHKCHLFMIISANCCVLFTCIPKWNIEFVNTSTTNNIRNQTLQFSYFLSFLVLYIRSFSRDYLPIALY